MFLGKGVLKICSKFTGEHPCRNAIPHFGMGVNLLHIFRIPFLKNTSGRLLLRPVFWHILLSDMEADEVVSTEKN